MTEHGTKINSIQQYVTKATKVPDKKAHIFDELLIKQKVNKIDFSSAEWRSHSAVIKRRNSETITAYELDVLHTSYSSKKHCKSAGNKNEFY